MPRSALAWVPAACWALFLFVLSEFRSAPAVVAPLLVVSDKLMHFVLYLALGGLLAWARGRSRVRIAHVSMVLLGVAYGAFDEWHQSFVPGRQSDVMDWVADIAGVVAGYVFITVVKFVGTTGPRADNRA